MSICRLMRIAWDSVGDIVTRVVADHLDESRLFDLILIGVDEIAYRRGGTPFFGPLTVRVEWS